MPRVIGFDQILARSTRPADCSERLLEPTPNCTMSDEEEITRKLPDGSKIVEKVKKTAEDDCEPDGKQIVRVVKKRKIDEIPAEYDFRSLLEYPAH